MSHTPLPMQRLGPYQLLREIGSGGMGQVWLAERIDEQYRSQVAIKLLRRGMASEAVLKRFRNERQILASLNHPNIASLLDGGITDDGLPYLVMEFIDGVSIDEYVRREALDVNACLRLFIKVCLAVQYAHQRLLIHRDIKPGNILVTADGTPKLLDFGIAKILQSASPELTMVQTAEATPLMTPQYASPEQVRGAAVTTATDVYGLGLLLYELLAGESPFAAQGRSTIEVFTAVATTLAEAPSQRLQRHTNDGQALRRSKNLRGDLDNIVLMALRKEPERRYQSAEQFAADIQRHLDAEPVLARPSTLAYRTDKFIRRNAGVVAASTLTLLALVAGIVTTTHESRVAQQERARAELRLTQVRRIANKLIFDYHDAIQYLPGSTPARGQLMRDAVSYLDALGSDTGNDPKFLTELATAYARVAFILGNAEGRPSLGDRAGAIANNGKAIALLQQLAAAPNADPESIYQLGGALTDIASIELDLGRITAAMPYYRQSAAAFERIIPRDGKHGTYRLELARTYLRIEMALFGQFNKPALSDEKAANDYLDKVDALVASMRREEPDNAELPHFLEWHYRQRRDALMNAGRVTEARQFNEKSLQLLLELARKDPINTAYSHDLASNHLWAAQNPESASPPLQTLELARRGFATMQSLASQDPSNLAAQLDLLVATQTVGVCQLPLDPTRARETLAQAVALALRLRANDAQGARIAGRSADALQALALAEQRTGDGVAALRSAEAAEAIWRSLAAIDANNAGARHRLAQLLLFKSELQARDPAAARASLEASAALWQQLEQQGRLRSADANRLKDVTALLARSSAPGAQIRNR